jgi:large subunit ribosomal protein L3
VKALLGRKLGMTQLFDDNGNVTRATVVEAGPCVVTQIKTTEQDGYAAIQIGFGADKRAAKPQIGHATHDGATPKQLREVRLEQDLTAEVEGEATLKVGEQIKVDSFELGDAVEVTGTSKGKGFAGTIKRHNFHRGPKTHGSHNYRQPGSIGSMYPQHVFKGIRMAGRMGGERVTVKGLKVVRIDADKNLLAISGAIPGPRKGIIIIRGAK